MSKRMNEEAIECWFWLKEKYNDLFVEFQSQLEEEE